MTQNSMQDTYRKNLNYIVSRLGYDPDEMSDCTIPPNLDLNEKKKLLNWKFRKGGHRLSVEIPKIPHVDETEIYSKLKADESAFHELSKRLTGDVRQILKEYLYARQQFDVLRQEKDLLNWHVASNSKILNLKESQVLGLETRNQALKKKIESLDSKNDRYEKERFHKSLEYKREEKLLKETAERYDQVYNEMQQWLGRRGDYIAETTVERRQANHERKLRIRQQKKLARACAVDKKWHVRIDGLRNMDNIIFDAYESTANAYAIEFDKAGMTTGPMRQNVMQEINELDPNEGYPTTSI